MPGRVARMNKSAKAMIAILAVLALAEAAWIAWDIWGKASSGEASLSVEETKLSERFEQALKEGDIEAWYQPIMDPRSGETVGAEALSHWEDENGAISAGEFVPVLEKTGQIVELDQYIFETVVDFQKKRQESGAELFHISVNLSAVSAQEEGVASEYESIYQQAGLEEGCINIEITETQDASSDELTQLVEAFHDAGFPVELDDFDEDYATLAKLAAIPYDIMKIDKSLIDLIGNGKAELLIGKLVEIADAFGMDTIAEGAETESQVAFLRDAGIDAVQGYYYSPSLSESDFLAYIVG